MRPLEELIDVHEPGIVLVREWADGPDAHPNVMLPPDVSSRGRALEHLQVTTRSSLGAVVYETGGLVVERGLLRIFGSGEARSILRANERVAAAKSGAVLMIADDFVGGLYALNGGVFERDSLGTVFHLAADQTRWESLEIGYTDFISWCLTGDLSAVYEDLRERDYHGAQTTEIDRVNAFYPFLWTTEGRRATNARLIDADESLRLRIELLGFDSFGTP